MKSSNNPVGELIKLLRKKSLKRIHEFCKKEAQLWYDYQYDISLIHHHFAPHELAYLQFQALKYCESFSNNSTVLSSSFLNRIDRVMRQLREENQIDNFKKAKDKLLFTDFYWNEQSIFQTTSEAYLYSLIRLFFIMENCAPSNPKLMFNEEEVLKNNHFSSFDFYVKSCLFLFLLIYTDSFDDMIPWLDKRKFDFHDDLFLLLNGLTVDKKLDSYIDKETWTFLLQKPFFRIEEQYYLTDKKIGLYALTNHLYYLLKASTTSFGSKFGEYFEIYIKRFLEKTLVPTQFKKIETSTKPMPDWEIELENYIFVVEQKSGTISEKTNDSEFQDSPILVENFIENNIYNKAAVQLNNYQSKSNKTIIRIVLTFEDIHSIYAIENRLIEQYGCDYWICTVSDFEPLIELNKENVTVFNAIVQEKHELNLNQAIGGRSLHELFVKYNKCLYNPSFLNQYKEIKFWDITNDFPKFQKMIFSDKNTKKN